MARYNATTLRRKGIVCEMAELNAAFCLVTRTIKLKNTNKKKYI